MQEEKTIEYLNTKMWYRLLKVIYIIAFILATVFSTAIGFDNKPRVSFDYYDTTISCIGGTTYKAGENNIYFSSANDTAIENGLKELCMSGRFPKNIFLYNHLSNISKNYTINYAYTNIGSWNDVARDVVIGFILIVIVFEILKRVFYYVVLGKIFPRRNVKPRAGTGL